MLYTGLVKTGVISLERLVELLSIRPRRRFHIPLGNDFCLWDLESSYIIDPECFASMSRATPFAGMSVQGRCVLTVYQGRTIYKDIEG